MRILIAYDGSDCSEVALRDLSLAGLPQEVEAQIFSVVEPTPELAPSPVGSLSGAIGWYTPAAALDDVLSPAKRIEETRHMAAVAAERVRHEFPAWSVEVDTAYGSPAASILDHARLWKPDLLVMGSHGHSGFSRLILGDVSQHVLNHAHCPVRIARQAIGSKEGPPRLILAIDASTDAAQAQQAVANRNWPAGTQARVIGVVHGGVDMDISAAMSSGLPHQVEEFRTWITHATRDAAAQLNLRGIKASHLVLSGDPAPTLIQAASDWPADCIFLGARGVGTIHRVLLGSVSSEVASHAHCTVEVVRPSA